MSDDLFKMIEEVKSVEFKEEWHAPYEWVGLKARAFIKQTLKVMIPYLVWGAIFSFVYWRGGYPSLIISISLAVLYSLNKKKEVY